MYWRGYADAMIYAQENLIPKKKEKKVRNRPKNYKIVYEDRWKTEEIFCESLKRAEKIAERMTRYNKSAKATVSKVIKEKSTVKPTCSVCGTTENVRWMGGYQPYLCNSKDCIPF
jgi:hypothetical protein